MTTLQNTFESGSDTTAISTGNSGGSESTAFDALSSTGAGTVLAYSATHAAHSSLSMHIQLPASVSASAWVDWAAAMGTQSKVWFRLYLYHTANPTVRTRVWQADISGSTLCGGLFLNTNGKLDMSASGGTAVITATNASPLSAWYRVEGFLTGNTSTGQVSFSVYTTPMDGTTALETQTSTANQNTGGSPNTYRFGDFAGTTETSQWDLWIDDIGLSSTAALGPAIPATKTVNGLQAAVTRGAFYG